MAESMEKEGKPIPPDLKDAYDAHKKGKGASPASQGGSDVAKEAAEKEAAEKAEADAAAAAKSTEIANEGKGDKGDDGVISPPPPARSIKTVPLAKYLETEKTVKKLEKDLSEALTKLQSSSQDDFEKDVATLAERIGLEPDQIKELDAFFSKRHQLPPDVLETLKEGKQIKEQEDFWKKQNERFDQEFAAEVETLKSSDPAEAKLMENQKAAIQELAFTEGFQTKSAWELWNRHVKPTLEPSRKTFERPGSGNAGASPSSRDWASIAKDPAKIRALSSSDYEEFSKWLESQDGSSRMRPAKRL